MQGVASIPIYPSAMHILFVCTGNICRSPFAEALGPLLSQEHTYASAGTRPLLGEPASATGITTAANHFGADMTSHRARELTPDLVAEADVVFAMEQHHADAVEAMNPQARVELLLPDGGPVPDPYGGDEGAYLVSYSLISRALGLRLHPDD